MDAREVTTYVANLDKAIKGNLPPPHLVDLLTSLKTGVVATEKLLRVSAPYQSAIARAVHRFNSAPRKPESEWQSTNCATTPTPRCRN